MIAAARFCGQRFSWKNGPDGTKRVEVEVAGDTNAIVPGQDFLGMRVKDIMTKRPATIPATSTMAAAANVMLLNKQSCVVVTDVKGQACGILTERDFTAREATNPFEPMQAPILFGRNVRRHGLERIYEEARTIPVRKAMRPIAQTLSEDDFLEKAVDQMVRHEVQNLPVLRAGKPVGILTRHDLLRLAVSVKPTGTLSYKALPRAVVATPRRRKATATRPARNSTRRARPLVAP